MNLATLALCTAAACTTPACTSPDSLPVVTATYYNADIRDVIAAFASLADRTIVVGRDVSGIISAEIRNQPWRTALNALLQTHGLAATEDTTSGIISIDSYANLQQRHALEPLTTVLIPLNYANADSLVPIITKLLAQDCINATSPPLAVSPLPSVTPPVCRTRGAVAANTATNTLILTETTTRIATIRNYLDALDIRTPQVSINAKIIFINRTSLEGLGIAYDIGTPNHYFSDLIPRTPAIDPTQPSATETSTIPEHTVALGGNALAAVANANARIAKPALSILYSAALGKSSLSAFLEALRETRLADLQAEPTIVTVDNRQAQIQVGQDVPVRVLDANTATATDASTISAPRATVSFRQVGIILRVTPHVTHNNHVLLDVHAENSNAELASSDVGYVFNKQSANNRILVANGHTAVIGGLTVSQTSESRTGIPFLMDLPLIGALFRSTSKIQEKRDLMILITPKILP